MPAGGLRECTPGDSLVNSLSTGGRVVWIARARACLSDLEYVDRDETTKERCSLSEMFRSSQCVVERKDTQPTSG